MSPTHRFSALLGLLLLAAGAARADPDPTVAAVLHVEDDGWGRGDVTEPLGAALYGRFLAEGPYAEVARLTGRERAHERVAAAIRDLAARHDMVDVFLSVHTTRRDPERWAERIPPAARRLRLVYSTACHGDDAEREAWEAVRPRTIVTHEGINNPVLALPTILAGWIAGEPIGDVVTEGYRLTVRSEALAASFPGGDAIRMPDPAGSRPVVTGDRHLTIGAGLRGPLPAVRPELRLSARRGGVPGLALRALALEGFRVDGVGALRFADLTTLLPAAIPAEALERARSVGAESPARGEVVARFADETEVPLGRGFRLVLDEEVAVWASRFDIDAQRFELKARGLAVRWKILKARVDRLALKPMPLLGGYRAEASVGVFGWVPFSFTLPVGGGDPEPVVVESPIFRPMPAARGLSAAVAGAALGAE